MSDFKAERERIQAKVYREAERLMPPGWNDKAQRDEDFRRFVRAEWARLQLEWAAERSKATRPDGAA